MNRKPHKTYRREFKMEAMRLGGCFPAFGKFRPSAALLPAVEAEERVEPFQRQLRQRVSFLNACKTWKECKLQGEIAGEENDESGDVDELSLVVF